MYSLIVLLLLGCDLNLSPLQKKQQKSCFTTDVHQCDLYHIVKSFIFPLKISLFSSFKAKISLPSIFVMHNLTDSVLKESISSLSYHSRSVLLPPVGFNRNHCDTARTFHIVQSNHAVTCAADRWDISD